MEKICQPALPGSGATLPEPAKALSRVQHGYGTTLPCYHSPYAGPIALQRKVAYLQVPMALRRTGDGASISSGPARPIALSCFDQLPVGVGPPPERGERLIERPAEIGELVQGCRAHSPGIEMPPDEAVALGASQRVGEHLVRDAIQYVMEILEAETPGSQLSEHPRVQRPPISRTRA